MATLHYFPLRGRGEMIRLAYAYKGVELKEETIDFQAMKTDLDTFPFGQCPRLVDGDVDAVQSNAIMRFIGRKYDLYGSSIKEAALVDMVIDGAEAIKGKYLDMIYQHQLATKDEFAKAHIDPGTAAGQRNGGAHWDYLARLLDKNGGEHFAGSSLSIADIIVWDLLDTQLRLYEDLFKQHYPGLMSFYAKVAATPSIKAFLEGPARSEKVNGNGLG